MSDDKTIIADGAVMSLFKAAKRVSACLVQYNGTDLGKRYLLNKDSMIIGRSPEADIVINEQSVSRQHARCFSHEETFEVEDKGSSNGTFINDQRIATRTKLKDGDIVRIGTVLLKFFSHNNIENLVQDKIYRMATIDAGTETFNKKHLLETLDQEFQFAKATGRDLSVIYFDLDFFKKVNDTYGHSAGDFILKETSTLVKQIVRKDDIFCRFGGEEFVILLPNTTAKIAYELAERVRSTVQAHSFQFEGKVIAQTISLGVSQMNQTMKEPSHLLDDADRKLYRSKQNGRNQITI